MLRFMHYHYTSKIKVLKTRDRYFLQSIKIEDKGIKMYKRIFALVLRKTCNQTQRSIV